MNHELRELYQQVILDHNKSPRNFREMNNATQHAEGYNPLCGDHIDVYLLIEDGIVKDVSNNDIGSTGNTAVFSGVTNGPIPNARIVVIGANGPAYYSENKLAH